MRVKTTELPDVLVLVPEPFFDERGFFTRTFDAGIFDSAVGRPGASAEFLQDSQSRSRRGTIRGMHGRGGRGEAKLVRCARGAVLDVIVDIRPESPAFGKSIAVTLDDETFTHLYVPPGFLHGFQALTEYADVCYRIDRPHDPTEDLAVAHDDPDLGLEWPLPVGPISERDRSAPSWDALLDRLDLPYGDTN
ncbi:dTDP-4-dehydrorhamnose 3,5-epimerase [Dietzia sp. ANT_WB102]|uniref:dTDP-4-dehydrorhamnose 3,5-epimerase n=1 Tax=Dietzia sp. ANT_WB102 TaxID=2597345 RepID=UPI0011EDF72C|nr:dTDP-4-dehydrorhamnose 3,5-epimerase [Dietzia sp. ANT_WB102]KAA0919358.1 dTDP-4-dehydrorhamnose 3,5-epimerase [Dietzia sp. ANT_WB102]